MWLTKKVVEFLDLTLDLRTGIYKPYKKPDNNITYIQIQSNNPPFIIKNLPKGINKRLSSNSNDAQTFKEAIPPYIVSLEKSEYNPNLQFDTASTKKSNEKKHQCGHQCCQNLPLSDRQAFPKEQQIEQNLRQKHLKSQLQLSPKRNTNDNQ